MDFTPHVRIFCVRVLLLLMWFVPVVPFSLALYPDTATLVSVAVKLGYGTAAGLPDWRPL